MVPHSALPETFRGCDTGIRDAVGGFESELCETQGQQSVSQYDLNYTLWASSERPACSLSNKGIEF